MDEWEGQQAQINKCQNLWAVIMSNKEDVRTCRESQKKKIRNKEKKVKK